MYLDLNEDGQHRYFFDNEKTMAHQALIIGLRELNETEKDQHCLNRSIPIIPINNDAFRFTANYQLRVYTSGCYYIDENGQWKADGLVVSNSFTILIWPPEFLSNRLDQRRIMRRHNVFRHT